MFSYHISTMQLFGRALGQDGRMMGSQLTGGGKSFGSQLGSTRAQHKRHFAPENKDPSSGLERGSSSGSSNRTPLDGQQFMTLGSASRASWQRKKNH